MPAFWSGAAVAEWSASSETWKPLKLSAAPSTLASDAYAVLAPSSTLSLTISETLSVMGLIVDSGANVTLSGPGSLVSSGTWNKAGSGTLTGSPLFTWLGENQAASFDTSVVGVVSMTVTSTVFVGPDTLTWLGTAGTLWDYVLESWSGKTGVTTFEDGDSVVFSGSPSNRTLTLSTTVTPPPSPLILPLAGRSVARVPSRAPVHS